MEAAATRIAGLDGLRAIAVLAVFAAHRAALPPGHHLGFWGVAAFFCLSGYLITRILHGYRLEIEGSPATGWGQYRRFLYRRTLRIGASEVLYYTAPTGSFGLLASGGVFALKGERLLKSRVVRLGFAGLAAATGLLIVASVAGWRPPLPVWLYFALAALVGSWLVATIHRRARPAALALLEWPPLRFLGNRSYGFYLFHFVQTWPVVLWANDRFGLGWSETGLALAFVAADFVCALVLAALSWSLVEKPILAFRDRPARRPVSLAPA